MYKQTLTELTNNKFQKNCSKVLDYYMQMEGQPCWS